MTLSNPTSLTLTQPDDWHIHLRDDTALARTVNDAARQFERAIVMPNLKPPVTNMDRAQAYHQRITRALDSELSFSPLMTLYLTDNTPEATVKAAADSEIVQAFKWYPAGATTNSSDGVTDVKHIYPALEAMQKYGVVLAVHGEVTQPEIDIFDREARFIEQTLAAVVADFPALKIVFEHISTRHAADFVRDAPTTVGATITAHHLLYNRNHLLAGGVRPHYYCLPVLKRSEHQQALIRAATSGSPKFFLGTDSAPHVRHDKETACGCAGIYSAHAAIEFYATVFEQADALNKLEAFAAFYGPDFYGLPRNSHSITLIKQPWQVPDQLPMGDAPVVPLAAGETLTWKLVN